MEEAEEYTLPLDVLEARLRTNIKLGLSEQDAEERFRVYGPNSIPRIKPSLLKNFLAPWHNWLISIYLVICAVLAFIALFVLPRVYFQVVEWLAVITVNAAIAIIQQVRSQASIEALQKLSSPTSRVVRDNALVEVPSEQIVPGDVVRLQPGDRVPADARAISTSSLRVDESSLTGESREVEKLEDYLPAKDCPISDRRNMVYFGTFVTAGSAKTLVVATGRMTQIGKMSKTLEQLNTGEIPLRQKTNKLAKNLGIAVLVFLCVSFTYNMLLAYLNGSLFVGNAWDIRLVAENLVRSLTTAMSIMPINIPLLTTIVLATGVLAMAKHEVIVRNLSAIESLGRVSVICCDKTGTITENEMTVRWIFVPGEDGKDLFYGVTGTGFQPNGEIMVDPRPDINEIIREEGAIQDQSEAQIRPETPLEYILASSLLNNESIIIEEPKNGCETKQNVRRLRGDTTDSSLLILFQKSKLDERAYTDRFVEVRSYPFDSRLKRMTKVFKDESSNRYVIFVKGATEIILPRCSSVARAERVEGEPLKEGEKASIHDKVRLFSSSGYRVISFAFKYSDESAVSCERESLETGLTYLGFTAIIDPPREGVRQSVAEVRGAGIKPVMITGDSRETAETIARQVGIAEEGDIAAEGSAVQSLPSEDFTKATVFARVSPQDKMIIVDRYKKEDRVVAMTGDGVNDAQALSMADVGIAMRVSGTDVARQAADMIIADDSFNSIAEGVREGRGVFQKIQNVIFFYVAVNLAEALLYFGSSMIPGFHLLNTWQMIYIFITAHSLPPFALIIGQLSKDIMKERPRDTGEIFTRQRKVALFLFSISLAIIFYVAYFGTLNGLIPLFGENKMGYIPSLGSLYPSPVSWAQAKARTMLHSVAFVAECTLVVSLLRLDKPIYRTVREERNWAVWLLILLVPIAHLVLMYIPGTQLLLMRVGINLEIVQLSWADWIIVIVLGLIPTVLLELQKSRLTTSHTIPNTVTMSRPYGGKLAGWTEAEASWRHPRSVAVTIAESRESQYHRRPNT